MEIFHWIIDQLWAAGCARWKVRSTTWSGLAGTSFPRLLLRLFLTIIRIHPLGTMNFCTKCQVNVSVSYWDISLWTAALSKIGVGRNKKQNNLLRQPETKVWQSFCERLFMYYSLFPWLASWWATANIQQSLIHLNQSICSAKKKKWDARRVLTQSILPHVG